MTEKVRIILHKNFVVYIWFGCVCANAAHDIVMNKLKPLCSEHTRYRLVAPSPVCDVNVPPGQYPLFQP